MMNIWNLHGLARVAAERESRMAVLVLEYALDEAGWFTCANAQRVYDVLLPGLRVNEVWPGTAESAREWFASGFRQAEVCETALSLFGRRFLNALVTVLNDQCSTSPEGKP